MSDWRRQFPYFATAGAAAYLDSAATGQKPEAVLTAMHQFAAERYGNIHRGVHSLAEASTAAYEAARQKVAAFVGAQSAEEIVFTAGTTAGVNIAAESLRRGGFLPQGACILVTQLEHHSNFLPWQRLAADVGGKLLIAPITPQGDLDMPALEKLFVQHKIAVFAFAHVSNVLGTVLPVKELAALARKHGAISFVDGAQAVAHLPVQEAQAGVDFYAFSAHKLYGPTGIGVLYIRSTVGEKLPPALLGGGMVHRVGADFASTTWAPPPARWEAGTPPIVEAVGLHAAVDFVAQCGFEKIAAHETQLTQKLIEALSEIKGLTMYGRPQNRVGVVAFNVGDLHPHDVGSILSAQGVAVRVGHHCAQPLMQHLGIAACVRASLGLYNNAQDIDALVRGLHTAQKKFA